MPRPRDNSSNGPDAEVEVAYWFISRREKFALRSYTVSEDTMRATQAVLRVAVDGIANGLFPPRPTKHSGGYSCAYCDPDGLGDRTSLDRFEELLAADLLADYADVIVGSTGMLTAADAGGDGMTTLLDQPDRDRARHALDETIFVTAGAGAGKTKVLVDRICSLVTDAANPVPMRAVAAVTFTEKAAAEMRDKIRAELSKRAHDKDADVAQRARDALDELDMAAIGTLHSFASRLLMENPIEAHLPPVISPMDEVASSVRSERWWSQIRTRCWRATRRPKPCRS